MAAKAKSEVAVGAMQMKHKRMKATDYACDFPKCCSRHRATMLLLGYVGGRYCGRHMKEMVKVYEDARAGP